jgi:anti-sigma-K factor RskA
MRKLPEDLAHRLAAEHALGTLRGRARARFEAIARSDPAVEAIRRRWEQALAPLAERVEAVEPPARVWTRIEERIGAAPARGGPWSSVSFWRSFGLLSGGVAAVLLTAFLFLQGGPRAAPEYVAVLVSPTNEARITISVQGEAMRVHSVRGWKSVQDAGRDLELWALPHEGPPRSLGLLANTGGDFVMRIAPGDPRLRDVKAFALSSEPPGGSPTRQPTGPVLCSGMAGAGRKI